MSSPSENTLKIGIVGFGPFAQFLAKTMIKQGHSITATSRSDYSNLCTQMGISFFRNMNEFLESDNDVILFCTSILSLSQVISTIPFNFMKKPALFADVLSVKEHPRDLMLQVCTFFEILDSCFMIMDCFSVLYVWMETNSFSGKVLPHESDVLCTHPMFGPDSGKHGWNGLSFMYDKIRIRNEDICSSFLQIFASEGCKMMEMTCEEHDKSAARTQFVTHFIGRLLGQMDIERTPIDTLGFQKLVEVVVLRNAKSRTKDC
ncbi:arogenate dehydrogenase 1, chloroplastic-like isoform X3 [Primulina huaijiensis]|uniref:arogenate dehydrogenase 1, chloroplastic-like isoform X3 n=1 Tax=Primulina huaijiensis TaxID=1492673 RepID=UPI003CC71E75